MKRLGIIGAGRVGLTVGHLLKKKGYEVSGVANSSLETSLRAAETLETRAGLPETLASASQIVLITTPDDLIGKVCGEIADRGGFRPGQLVLHMSGALPSAVLEPARRSGCLIGSAHPIRSFARFDPDTSLHGTYFGIEGDPEAVPLLRQLVSDLEGIPVEIHPEAKVLYHAACVVVSNYLVALAHLGVRLCAEAGVKSQDALPALIPLMEGTLSNLKTVGLPHALTGPISRGDSLTVSKHLTEIGDVDSQLAGLYRVLGEYTVGVAAEKGNLPASKLLEMEKLLSGKTQAECGGSDMKTVSNIPELKETLRPHRQAGRTIGLVPTMGYLHEGHLSLVREARRQNDIVVMSIFVNPLQFGRGEDYAEYPRDVVRDSALAGANGVDVLFVPSPEEMYPKGHATFVEVEGLTNVLCGRSRPGHFRGVTTVVAKLFNIVSPDRAYFGLKDFQQAVVIKRMVRDLNMDIEIVTMPIVREPDGLAMSSRNAYLNPGERHAARVLYRSLEEARRAILEGERRAEIVRGLVLKRIRQQPEANVDYVSINDAETLEELDELRGSVLIALAVRFGRTRLIDNIQVHIPDGTEGGSTP